MVETPARCAFALSWHALGRIVAPHPIERGGSVDNKQNGRPTASPRVVDGFGMSCRTPERNRVWGRWLAEITLARSGLRLAYEVSDRGQGGHCNTRRCFMRGVWLVVSIVMLLSFGAVWSMGARAQDATPAASPAAGPVGVTAELLGSGQPSVAPGHELSLRRITIAPGGGIPAITPGALIIYLESGTWGYTALGPGYPADTGDRRWHAWSDRGDGGWRGDHPQCR